jgi:hypothetical protein
MNVSRSVPQKGRGRGGGALIVNTDIDSITIVAMIQREKEGGEDTDIDSITIEAMIERAKERGERTLTDCQDYH